MRINFGDGTLRGNLLAASKLAAMDQKPQSSELFEAAAARIAALEAIIHRYHHIHVRDGQEDYLESGLYEDACALMPELARLHEKN